VRERKIEEESERAGESKKTREREQKSEGESKKARKRTKKQTRKR